MMNSRRSSTSTSLTAVVDSRERNRLRIVATAILFSLAVLALLLPRLVLAQAGLSKCTDGNRITYSSTTCDTIGLKTAGQINDRLTIIPAMDALRKPPAVPPAAQQMSQPAQTASMKETDMPRGAGIQPINPMVQGLIRK